ncbi:unnamed protein product, partial [marine sediment metagenome]
EIYLETSGENGKVLLSDHGMTIIQLSCEYDMDTPNKRRIFNKMLSENQLQKKDGRLYLDDFKSHGEAFLNREAA